MSRPRILITNDDGIDAPGIKALAEALSQLGEVTVVAPDGERSAVARAVSLERPLRMKARGPGRWAVDGTPTDCIYLAMHSLLELRPELVVSGINRGPNLGDDMTYSGTVAGAMEGALLGIPAFAISLDGERPSHYEPAANFAVSVAEFLLKTPMPQRSLLNVNVPDTQGRAVPGFRWTSAGHRDYGHKVTTRVDPRGRPYHWIGGRILGFESVEGSDCDAVAEGLAAITPITMDLTHRALLAQFSAATLTGFDLR